MEKRGDEGAYNIGVLKLANEKRPRERHGRSGVVPIIQRAYFVQKVARLWQVTMPPSGLHLDTLFVTL